MANLTLSLTPMAAALASVKEWRMVGGALLGFLLISALLALPRASCPAERDTA